jgi:hypothetical protein
MHVLVVGMLMYQTVKLCLFRCEAFVYIAGKQSGNLKRSVFVGY